MWECGLKRTVHCRSVQTGASHSLCGSVDWNRDACEGLNTLGVTPYVGVWIETPLSITDEAVRSGHSLCGSVDWNFVALTCSMLEPVTPYVGVWIETRHPRTASDPWRGHSLCGSVDWNLFGNSIKGPRRSHSLCGSVDWNVDFETYSGTDIKSLLMWECGLKPSRNHRGTQSSSHSLCGSVDWNRNISVRVRGAYVTPYVGVWIETPRKRLQV